MSTEFWRGRRVFVTGHTGFKGSWLCAWLQQLGAEITGFALEPPTTPNLFHVAGLERRMRSCIGEIRDLSSLTTALARSRAEVVFHLAAQPQVRQSYKQPVDTYSTNVMGTVNMLEAARCCGHVRSVVVVTSDKCYENGAYRRPYSEDDRLGGRDPYSSSKACAEMITAAYRDSFFAVEGRPAVASARAGNVVGGGDWSSDRLVPDLMRAFVSRQPALVRNPLATRPWQHVLEPLRGYLLLAEALATGEPRSRGWNFGPDEADARQVAWIANVMAGLWGGGASWRADERAHPHEDLILLLDSTRAKIDLGWRPLLTLSTALEWIVQWHRAYAASASEAREAMLAQITAFEGLAVQPGLTRAS